MCLAVPTLVKKIDGQEAEVETGGVTRRISIVITPEVKVGDYVLVHTGYAITVMSGDEARESLRQLTELAEFM
ncbi:MAG: HypC/HybG/HupF family hydrogenase formation chaperone [Deltaproteobacteria bacterium]|nr:HypC/HybG/HupF family hydrogenase formation chaperone [Deltaproteobacteria bacterium]MBW2084902.1 HypC/HybG/HupF family hydrogenase formation chaperone [Deltaproteobacteria bacterium]